MSTRALAHAKQEKGIFDAFLVAYPYVTQDQRGQEASDVWPWPTWKVELVHEMLHEWEHKAVAAPSAAGEALWRSNLARFDVDHQAAFFTAIVDKATYFGLAPEELIATL